MKTLKKIISLILTAAIMVSMVCVGTVNAGAFYSWSERSKTANVIENEQTLTTTSKESTYKYEPTSSSVTFKITSYDYEQTSFSLYNSDGSDFKWADYTWENNIMVDMIEYVKIELIEGELDTRKGGWGAFPDKKTGRTIFKITVSITDKTSLYLSVYGYNENGSSGKIKVSVLNRKADDASSAKKTSPPLTSPSAQNTATQAAM